MQNLERREGTLGTILRFVFGIVSFQLISSFFIMFGRLADRNKFEGVGYCQSYSSAHLFVQGSSLN